MLAAIDEVLYIARIRDLISIIVRIISNFGKFVRLKPILNGCFSMIGHHSRWEEGKEFDFY
ncbi:hypothetical protein D3C81_1901630 [compost metagenome]